MIEKIQLQKELEWHEVQIHDLGQILADAENSDKDVAISGCKKSLIELRIKYYKKQCCTIHLLLDVL